MALNLLVDVYPGRLVPHQPRAIKSTTRTELPHEDIYIAKFIHWNNGAIPT